MFIYLRRGKCANSAMLLRYFMHISYHKSFRYGPSIDYISTSAAIIEELFITYLQDDSKLESR